MSTNDRPAAQRELVAFFERYASLYMAGDAAAVSELYEAPFLAVRAGTPIHLPDRRSVLDHLTGLMEAYRNAGAAAADVAEIEVLEQGDAALIATVHWQVRAADGSMVRDFRTSYQMVGPGTWIILAYVNHDFIHR